MNNTKKKSQDFITTFQMTKYVIKLICKDKPGKIYTWIKILLTPVFSLIPLVYVVIPGLIITELSEAQRIEKLVFYVGIMVFVPVLNTILDIITRKYLQTCRMRIETRLHADLYKHMYSLDYKTVEDPSIQLIQERAVCTHGEFTYVIDGMMELIKALIKFVVLFSLISQLSPLFILLIIFFVFINSVVVKKVNQEKYEFDIEIKKYNRSVYGTTTVLDRFEYVSEVRLYNLLPFFLKKFVEKKTEMDAVELKKNLCSNKSTISSSVTNFIQQLIVYIYVIYKVIKKNMSVGDMTIYMSAISQFSAALSSVSKTYLVLASRNMKIKEYIDLYNLTQTQHHTGSRIPVINKNSVIEFKNVFFKYPGSNSYAIDNLSIKIRADEKLCIVGENGSGKSTFIKLLTRLYYPEKGEILLDGVNINEFDYTEYIKLFASTLQDFSLYYVSIKENIILDKVAEQERLEMVYKQSGLTPLLQKVAHGEDTQVYKWEALDGFRPSGGEGQRIAIARAIYRNAPIILLDEPTAALDPNAECEIYTQFHNMIHDKCAILITHRLSAVQLSDKVAVFSNGNILEYGTHKELYAKGGSYTEMFNNQAQFYRYDTTESSKIE